MRHGRRWGRGGRGGRRRRLSPPWRRRVIDVDDLVYGRYRRKQGMRVERLNGVVVDLRRDLRPERGNQAWAHQGDEPCRCTCTQHEQEELPGPVPLWPLLLRAVLAFPSSSEFANDHVDLPFHTPRRPLVGAVDTPKTSGAAKVGIP
jgi:hypothetical protein